MAKDNNKESQSNNQEKYQGKSIKTGTMIIKGYLLQLPSIIIRISNISAITASKVRMPPTVFSIIITVIGFSMSGTGYEMQKAGRGYYNFYVSRDMFIQGRILFIIGFVIFLIGIWRMFFLRKKTLNIYLNCGVRYSIVFKNEQFMIRVLDVLTNIFESGGSSSKEYNINIKDCEFVNSAAINAGTLNN